MLLPLIRPVPLFSGRKRWLRRRRRRKGALGGNLLVPLQRLPRRLGSLSVRQAGLSAAKQARNDESYHNVTNSPLGRGQGWVFTGGQPACRRQGVCFSPKTRAFNPFRLPRLSAMNPPSLILRLRSVQAKGRSFFIVIASQSTARRAQRGNLLVPLQRLPRRLTMTNPFKLQPILKSSNQPIFKLIHCYINQLLHFHINPLIH